MQFIKSKKRKTSPLESIPCCKCKTGRAFNKQEIYQKYRSPKFAKLRNAVNKPVTKSQPTVGKNSHIEAALRNPDLLPVIAPPRVLPKYLEWIANHQDSFTAEIIKYACGGVLAIGLGAIALLLFNSGFEKIAEFLEDYAKIFVALLIFASVIFFNSFREKKENKALQEWAATWHCLQCGEQFLNKKKNISN